MSSVSSECFISGHSYQNFLFPFSYFNTMLRILKKKSIRILENYLGPKLDYEDDGENKIIKKNDKILLTVYRVYRSLKVRQYD
jgi:hypothetical protein